MSLPAEVKLIRRVAFSAGHRYWLHSLSDEENRRLFGRWASPYNHGHNYVLEAEISGEVDTQTGMVVNIKDLDAVLQENVVDVLDQKSLNDEIEFFAERAPSLENVLLFLQEQIGPSPAGIRLSRLTLFETPLLWANMEIVNRQSKIVNPMTLTRSYEFAASHRLHNPLLPQEENEQLYGKCNNPAGHGHNYVLEVTVEGVPDPQTGMMVDLSDLDRVVEEKVVDRYDHKNLSEDLPEFRGRIATSEVVVQEIWRVLEEAVHLLPQTPSSSSLRSDEKGAFQLKLAKVRLQETARNVFEVSREPADANS